MGPDNLNPLDELKSLDRQIELVTELAGLKPIFFRLDEIAKENVNDFDVQLQVGDLKQHLVNRGAKLKEMKEARPTAITPPPLPAPPPAPTPIAAIPAEPPMERSPQTPLAVPGPPPPPQVARQPEPPPPPPMPPVPPPPPAPPVAPGSGIRQSPPQPPPQSPQGAWATTENAPVSTPPPPSRPIPPPAKPPAPVVTRPAVSKPPASKPAQPANWKQPLMLGTLFGAILVVALTVGVIVHKRREKQAALTAAVQVQIATNPPGASVRIGGDAACTSDCSISLAPGNYQITAFLDGYEPAASGIAVTPGQPVTVTLALEPQAQSLRILTDLDQGKVAIDDQPPADLQEGQFIVDRVLPGMHTVKITGKGGDALFSFEIADARQPVITGALTAHNLSAVLVASLGDQAHVVTNSGPLKVAVNGQAEEDAGPAGVDLKTFKAGVDELVVGDGKDQVSVKESFGPAPMLTAFFKSGVSGNGTLIVSTGEDGVHVFLNGKEYPRLTTRGQIRIPTLGPVQVRVAKAGFDSPPAQTADVKKGAETRLEFKLKASSQFATLQVLGGTPGAEVLIDQRSLGIVGPDGGFSSGSVAPGDHVVEIRRDGYTSHRLPKTFRAGLTVTVVGADAILSAAPAPIPPPAPPKAEPPPVVVARKEVPPPPAAPKVGTMDDWEDPSAWKSEGGVWLHQGKGFVPFKLTPNGVFTFTVQLVKGGGIFHGGKISWCFEYLDSKNYTLYEMDNKNFWARVVSKGKTSERTHIQLKDLAKQKSFTIQIEVTPEHVVHKLFTGGEWMNLDVWAETGRSFTEGKFGFLFPNNDEIGLTDFKFQPK